MTHLPEIIQKSAPEILGHVLHMTEAQWKNLIARLLQFLEKAESSDQTIECYDEQIWTFLLAVGFASGDDKRGIFELGKHLGAKNSGHSPTLWMEALPIPPRMKEGNTNLDLAWGGIKMRGISKERGGLGIEYDPRASEEIIFCEMKWYSDISKNVTHDQRRNQLARVIENALTFQCDGAFPERCVVTLITPKAFVGQSPKSRLYQYKFEEYLSSFSNIVAEFENCSDTMPRRQQSDWNYPESIQDRLKRLTLYHISFEELFEALPPSELRSNIQEFAIRYNRS
ncbi:MAG: hypothetical protein AAGA58_02900 [Verrucomicrobiota bacterium]